MFRYKTLAHVLNALRTHKTHSNAHTAAATIANGSVPGPAAKAERSGE